MKRLTIDQTWERTLKMWKWISRQCKGKSQSWCSKNVDSLKIQWLNANGPPPGTLDYDCFLCDYDLHKQDGCQTCPPKRIDKYFSCGNRKYCFESHPRKFYAKLKELNKIRLERKAK